MEAQAKKNPKGAHFERFEGRDKKWYYALVAGNNRITGPSEGYDDKSGATEGIVTHVNNCFETMGMARLGDAFFAAGQIDIRDRH